MKKLIFWMINGIILFSPISIGDKAYLSVSVTCLALALMLESSLKKSYDREVEEAYNSLLSGVNNG